MVIVSPPFTYMVEVGFLVLLLSFPLAIAEASAIRRFQPTWWYSRGPVVTSRRYPLVAGLALRDALEAPTSEPRFKYMVVEETTCLFRRKFLLAAIGRLCIKGRLRVLGKELLIEGRVPLSPCVALVGFLLIFGAVGLGGNNKPEAWGGAILFLIPLTLIMGAHLLIELWRFRKAARSLLENLQAG